MRQKEKFTIYLPAPIMADVRAEADRLDRTVSWVLARSYLIARAELHKMDPDPVSSARGLGAARPVVRAHDPTLVIGHPGDE